MIFKKAFFTFLMLFVIINENASKSVRNDKFFDFLERKLIRNIDEWDHQNERVNLVGDWMVLRKVRPEKGLIATRSFQAEEGTLLERMEKFFGEHRVEIKFPWSRETSEKLITESRSGKLKKFFIPFMVLMTLKKTIEIPIFLAVVSLLAFKGLGAGLVALMLSGATAFKSLLEHHHTSSKVSYEVVPPLTPAWSRSGIDYPNFPDSYHTISPNHNNHTNI